MNKKPPRLIIVVKNIDGGTGTFVLSLLKLKKLFKKKLTLFKVIVLEKPRYRKLDKKLLPLFIFIRTSNFYPYIYALSPKSVVDFVSDFFVLKKIINFYKPRVILGVDLYCNLNVLINKLLFFRKIKIVASTHISLNNNLQSKSSLLLRLLLKKVINIFYSKADVLISVSKNLSSSLVKDFNIKKSIITIYNGLDTKIRVKNNNFDKKIIITVSRLVEQKDHFTLIKAFFLIQKIFPNTKLWILGDGPLKKRLALFSQKLDLKRNIRFFGWKNNIYGLLKCASVFVLSTRREGFPYVILEAMSQKLPIISSDVSFGPSEALDKGKCGILVPINEEKKMAQEIISLLRNKKKYNFYAKRSLERSRYFSEEKMLQTYKKIIINLAKKTPN